MNADERTYHTVVAFLDRQKLERESEGDEQHCTKINVRSGQHRASISVYNSGNIVVGGKASPLKELLGQLKQGIDAGGTLPGQALPFEIDRFPKNRQPDADGAARKLRPAYAGIRDFLRVTSNSTLVARSILW